MNTRTAVGLVLLGLGIVIMLLPLAGSILYLVTGSLEINPTPEQQEKARIAGAVATTIFAAVEALLIATFVAIFRRNHRSQNKALDGTANGHQ